MANGLILLGKSVICLAKSVFGRKIGKFGYLCNVLTFTGNNNWIKEVNYNMCFEYIVKK